MESLNNGARKAEYNDEIMTKEVKAGRRTYFFDVKATRGDEQYLTITESRRVNREDGSISYDRHKLYLYKEDFEAFVETLNSSLDFIKQNNQNITQK